MEWYEIAADAGRTVKFAAKSLPPAVPNQNLQHQEKQINKTNYNVYSDRNCTRGGVIKQGEWAWLVNGCTLNIVALRNGQSVSAYEFTESRGYDKCNINWVEELYPHNTETVLLAICLESLSGLGSGCSYVALYSVVHSKVLCCIEMQLHITTAAFLSRNCCRHTLLRDFDGCLAVGTEEGIVVLLDLSMGQVMAMQIEQMATDRLAKSKIVGYNFPLTDMRRDFQQCRRNGDHFGLQLEAIDTPCAIQSLLPIELILGLAVGLEDGRLAFYDLAEMQIFHIALPGLQVSMAPIVKMCYMEPLDDPRHCIYIWAVHETGENLNAVFHTLVYEKRVLENDGFHYFEGFISSSVRLDLILETTKSVAVACQAIKKAIVNSNVLHSVEDSNCLCAFAWHSVLEKKKKLLIFDLNQWYKEEMPSALNRCENASFLAGYILNERQYSLHGYLNPSTIAHFNSMQRFEEHFYPNSYSFDFLQLLEDGCRSYTWIGAQNKLVNMLRCSNANIFLEPEAYFKEILRTRLLPQFLELNADSTFSRTAKYETILSVALEHNCLSLLRDCARSWADGSFMGGNFATATGISLSTLTEWMWKRAMDIKTRCNELSKGIFDYTGYPLDRREQKELGFITRQLKLLADLLSEILSNAKRHIPENVFSNLESRYKSLRLASQYQEVLMWLLNIGLLPEAAPRYGSNSADKRRILYPYAELKKSYAQKRDFFAQLNENFISKKTGSCRLLFIDAFIEHESKGDVLRENWLENGGNGLYPPTSIEALLRVMLVPEMQFEQKCAMLLYFFLDLHMNIDDEVHKEVVANFVKFPSVFMLTAPLIKTVQAFWNLDHGNFRLAVDEFISPFNNHQNYSQWMLELLIDALLTQNASNLALRILESRSTLISPILKLNTLLSNELISEAFHFARSKNDENLLEHFFKCCLCAGKYSVIRDLALTGKEGQLVQRILKLSKTHGAENLHFIYLLQKSRYLEAVSYLDELSNKNNSHTHFGNDATDTPNLVLSAFNTTMAPVTQGLTDVYFRIRNKIKKKEADNKSPVPLSCQLIKQNANDLLGGIYHSSALSAHFATYYWGEMESMNHDAPVANLLNSNNAPFLRKPQGENNYLNNMEQSSISYPQPYTLRVSEKRTREVEPDDSNDAMEIQQMHVKQTAKKRRRLIGQEIIDDLSNFADKNRTNKSVHQSVITKTDTNATTIKSTETPCKKEGNMVSFLTQPLTPRRRLGTEADRESRTGSAELHSILKTNTPERTERPYSSRRDIVIDEGKSLRFKLPVSELAQVDSVKVSPEGVGSRRHLITTTATIHASDVDDNNEETNKIIFKRQTEPPNLILKKHVSVARSISVSSEDGDPNETPPQSEEEDFYSPLHSPIKTPSPTHTGPQARKPLTHYSPQSSDAKLTERISSINQPDKPDVMDVEQQTKKTFREQQRLSSVISLTNIEFAPQSTSSVICESQSKFGLECKKKISECTTIVGEESGSETNSDGSTSPTYTKQINVPKFDELMDKQNPLQMHETTLDMSSEGYPYYDNKKAALLAAKSTIQTTEEDFKEDVLFVNTEDKVIESVETDDDALLLAADLREKAMDTSSDNLPSTASTQNNEDNDNEQVISILSSNTSSESVSEETTDDEEDVLVWDEGGEEEDMTEIENDEIGSNSEYAETVAESVTTGSNMASERHREGEVDKEHRYEEYEEEEDMTTVNDEIGTDSEYVDSNSSECEENVDVEEQSAEENITENDEEMSNYFTYDSTDDSRSCTGKAGPNISTAKQSQEHVINVEKSTNSAEESSTDSKILPEGSVQQMSVGTLIPDDKSLPEVFLVTEESCEQYVNEDDQEVSITSRKRLEVISGGNKNEEQKIDLSKELAEELMADVAEGDLDTEKSTEGKEEKEKVKSTSEMSQNITVNLAQSNIIRTDENALTIPVDVQEKDDQEVNSQKDDGDLREARNETSTSNKKTMKSQKTIHTDTDSHLENIPAVSKQSSAISQQEHVSSEKHFAPRKRTTSMEKTLEEAGDILLETPTVHRRSLRGTSVPPVEPTAPRSNKRGTSVPPQSLSELQATNVGEGQRPHRQRDMKNISQQLTEENNTIGTSIGTPRTRRSIRGGSVSLDIVNAAEDASTPKRRGRGSSMPPTSIDGSTPKVTARLRSSQFDAITPKRLVLDSPATRTRIRTRTTSGGSDLQASTVKVSVYSSGEKSMAKRTRRASFSSDVVDQSHTPKDTPTSHTESSATSNGQQSTETDPNVAASVTEAAEALAQEINVSPKSKDAGAIMPPSPSTMYSTERRMTRTQRAIIDKSAELFKKAAKGLDVASNIPGPSTRRGSKRANSRSSVQDSDDNASVSSHISGVSQASSRRVTRSSVKDKKEDLEDAASIAGSVGSERSYKRRSKEIPKSPIPSLDTIKEDDEEVEVAPKKRGRAAKHI